MLAAARTEPWLPKLDLSAINFDDSDDEDDANSDGLEFRGLKLAPICLSDRSTACTSKSSIDTEDGLEFGWLEQNDEDGPPEGAPAPRGKRRPSLTASAKEQRKLALERMADIVAKRRQSVEKGQLTMGRRRPSKSLTWPTVRFLVPTPAPTPPNRKETAIFFDWDDTLFPTWHLQDVVRPCVSEEEWREGLKSDSPFAQQLADHAQAIEAVLTAAQKVGRVAIVTLGVRPWVETSAARYLPGLQLEELLKKLNIPIYYAREHVRKADRGRREEGVNMWVVAKRNAFAAHLRKGRKGKVPMTNVVCVGDSQFEMEAIKEVMWDYDEDTSCKAVKLAAEPTLKQLTDELHLLTNCLPSLVAKKADLDLSMESVESMEFMAKLCGSDSPRK